MARTLQPWAPLIALSLLSCTRQAPEPGEPAEVTRRAIARDIEEGNEVGFAYAVVSANEVLFEDWSGRQDAASDARVTADTVFLSASTTKVLTAIATLRLVDQRKLALDAPLSQYTSIHPRGDAFTIRQLLTHAAGIPNPLPLDWLHKPADHASFDGEKTLARLLAQHPELKAGAGEEYGYSNLGYWLLQCAIESASGVSYEAWVRAEVLAPLGIPPEQLSFDHPRDERAARGHYARWSLLGAAIPWMTKPEFRAPAAASWGRFVPLYMDGPAYGGAFATVRGYARLLQALLNEDERLLSRSSHQALFAPALAKGGAALPVTLAFRSGKLGDEPYFEKPGGGPGFSANLRIYQRLGIATVFLSNQMRISEGAVDEVSDRLDRPFVEARKRSQGRQALVGQAQVSF